MLLQWVTLKAARKERFVQRMSGDEKKLLNGCEEG